MTTLETAISNNNKIYVVVMKDDARSLPAHYIESEGRGVYRFFSNAEEIAHFCDEAGISEDGLDIVEVTEQIALNQLLRILIKNDPDALMTFDNPNEVNQIRYARIVDYLETDAKG